ncbi:MAG: ABC transporter permease [Myxococcota bacterium]
MMRRLWLLARKEAQQHALALLVIGVLFAAFAALRWLSVHTDDRAPSEMEAARDVIFIFTPLASLILGHRLVVREYHAKTQLFLEALPLRRWEFVAVKFGFGLCVLGTLNAALLVTFAWLTGEASARFLFVAGARTVGFSVACWSLFFAMGLLGRLRFIAYVTLICGVVALNSLTSFEIDRFGPLELMNSMDFTYARTLFPVRALLESLGASVPLLLLGSLLALYSEGSLAEALSRRMSARESVTVGALMGAEIILVSWAAAKRPAPPVEFTSPFVVRSADQRTAIMYAFPELEPRARESLSALSALELRLRRDLGVQGLPPLRIAHSSLIDGGQVRHASSFSDALMLEVNLGARGYSLSKLLTSTVHGALSQASRGRAGFESNHWFLDGMSASMAASVEAGDVELGWLRALVAARRMRVDKVALLEWEHTMERVGEAQATALSFAFVQHLRQRLGDERVLELARAVLARPTVTGAYTYLKFGSNLLTRSVERLAREDFSALADGFRNELKSRAKDAKLATELARIPFDNSELVCQRGKLGVEVRYKFYGPALERERRCVLMHGLLRPYDRYYPPEELTREEFLVPRGKNEASGTLRGRYDVGQRVFAAVECELPELETWERIQVARLEAP